MSDSKVNESERNKHKVIEMTCIVCPIGCHLKVEVDEEGKFLSVSGNRCPRGAEYAKQEVTDPRRVLPTSVKVIDGELPLVSVRTEKAIPKRLIFEAMNVIKGLKVKAPVKRGQVIVENLLDTGVNLIATKTVEELREVNQNAKNRRNGAAI
jgi:CxxC motif-containing protein